MEKRKLPPRRRGYRIRIYLPGRPSVYLPLIWSTDPPMEVWELVKQDCSIVRAIMYRSGRPFEQFSKDLPLPKQASATAVQCAISVQTSGFRLLPSPGNSYDASTTRSPADSARARKGDDCS